MILVATMRKIKLDQSSLHPDDTSTASLRIIAYGIPEKQKFDLYHSKKDIFPTHHIPIRTLNICCISNSYRLP
jgi:hypothetical protein